MISCEFRNDCPYFSRRSKSGSISKARVKGSYCDGDHTGCARYIVARMLGRDGVPEDLDPTEVDRLREILSRVEKDSSAAPLHMAIS